MAKVIIITEEQFDLLFEAMLNKADLARANSTDKDARFANSPIGELAGAFRFYACGFRDQVKKATL